MLSPRYVVKEWQQSYIVTFAGCAGEQVSLSSESVMGKEGEWEGWIWVKDNRGISGWVPEALLVKEKDSFFLLRDFTATELSVSAGEKVIVSEEVAGWAWCTNIDKVSGWVPADCICAS